MDLEAALARVKELETSTADLTSQMESLKANNSSLIEEKRKETAEKQRLADEAKKIQQDLAKKNGDFDSIVKSVEEEKNKALEELTNLKGQIAHERMENIATKLAADLAHDADAADSLKELIMNRLKFDGEQVKILDKDKKISNLSIDDFKKEIQTTPRYRYMLKANPASGGRPINANGSAGSSSKTNDAKLSPVEKLNRARQKAQ